jgi:ABC-type enterobactin transport system permease subunit
MQTLSMIALVTAALTVAFVELRELFIAWYSGTLPSLTWSNYTISALQILLCLLVALLTLFRLTFRT